VADRIAWALVDRNARKGKLPSDHAPIVIDLTD
jgi:exodeoxyribonuclease-3